MAQVFDAGIAVREDGRDNAADEFLEGVASAEPERHQVIAIDGPGERRRVARRRAGVFERGQETAVDWARRVEGGEDLLLQQEGLICIYIYDLSTRFPDGMRCGTERTVVFQRLSEHLHQFDSCFPKLVFLALALAHTRVCPPCFLPIYVRKRSFYSRQLVLIV